VFSTTMCIPVVTLVRYELGENRRFMLLYLKKYFYFFSVKHGNVFIMYNCNKFRPYL
jgi:hypothetical protein